MLARVTRGAALRSRIAFALTFSLAFASYGAVGSARADETPAPTPTPSVAATACSLLDERAASELIGFELAPAERASSAAGICFFPSRRVSEEGSLSYAIVTDASLSHLRPYFAYLTRRCSSVSQKAPDAPLCKTYARVARAADIDAYFSARTDVPDATALPALGTRAFAADGTVFVATGDRVIETIVKRDGTFDLERSTTLAMRLLALVAPTITPLPSPTVSPHSF